MSVKETITHQLVRIGMDTSKKVFQLHGVDAQERVAPSRKLSRRGFLTRELYIGLDYEKVYFVEKKFS